MKRQNYTGEFDEFEVPSSIWTNVEEALNQDEKKKRVLIWWRIAGVLVLVLGTGAFFTFNKLSPNKQLTAKNEQIISKKQSKKVHLIKTKTVKSLPSSSEIGNESKDFKKQTAVSGSQVAPFVLIAPNGRNGAMGALTYSWTTPTITSTSALCSGTYSVLTADANGCTSNFTVANGSTTTNLVTVSGGTSPMYFSSARQGFSNGGPVNVPANGVVDGVYIQGHLPTKRMIPYETVNEAKLTYRNVTEEENIGRLNYRKDDYSDYLESESGSVYDAFVENDYLKTSEAPLSTFSIDVDGASYSDVRGMINRSEKPNVNSVRIEEFVNYFPYSYAEPVGEHPFSMHSEVAVCPWNKEHNLVKVGIKGKSIEKAQLPKNNLVFLLDVSGSMDQPEKIELLKKGFRMLIQEMREQDKISIVVYAGAAGVVLPPTSGTNKDQIMDALNNLQAGGSTAGGQGIELAYALAEKNFDKTGNNRVILATDGDFNVGVSDDNALVKLIEEKRESGVFLTVLGFGHDNFQSSKMEKLANNGNGNFSFVDNILEAKKVLVTEMGATLQTIAKDVKIQIEFNPQFVSAYRLIGYENRLLQNEDFSNDTIDAGELGAGHTVTAIYEVIPANGSADLDKTDDGLKYSKVSFESNGQFGNELATMKFRYKAPDGKESKLIEQTIPVKSETVSKDFEFITAVVEFGLILRESKYSGNANYDEILKRAQNAKGDDPFGYRSEFIMLVEKAKLMSMVN